MNFIDLGLLGYKAAFSIQKELVRKRIEEKIDDTILFIEHEPVITVGRLGGTHSLVRADRIAAHNIPVEFVDRGGEATYHAPGQLVIYPIIDLRRLKRDIRCYLSMLEAFLLGFLAECGLEGDLKNNTRGVWVKNKKIASVGIALSRWVTYHGMSINVDMDLGPFDFIDVCGMEAEKVTSIAREGKALFEMREIKAIAENEFRNSFRKTYSAYKIAEMAL